ncbi:MFS transporter [Desulfallas sp. Bu1-1]|uniref:MFS transporter n=1 Tax=Desulfallas sp. Bu1-1 TaxID=2787620 RepID=UPI00189D3B4C|nr:MFS transporter [Desulfallas sp. Bu1-1]MBF7082755.1 MFS transporter [Desulfallas sp. Bu1-1]
MGKAFQNNPGLVQKTISYSCVAFAILLLGYVLSVFHRLTIAIMADRLMTDLGLSAVQLGLLTAIYFYPYAFMQFPVGIMADHIGPRRLVSVMLLIAAAASIAFSVVQSFPLAVATRFLIGLSVSCVFVPTQKYIATFFPPSMFATLVSFLPFAGMLGGIFASVPLAYLVDAFGWRVVFFILGIITAFLALGVWIFVAELPGHSRDSSEVKNRETVPMSGKKAVKPGFLSSFVQVISEWGLWPIAIRNFLNYGSIMAFQSLWAGPYLMLIVGVDRITAGYLLMLLSVGQLVTAPFSGYLSERVFRSRKIPAVSAAFGLVLFWVPFAFYGENLTPVQIGMLFVINGLWNGLAMGAGLAQIKELYPVSVSGTAIGIGNLFTMAGPCLFPVFISSVMAGHTPAGGRITGETFILGFRYLMFAAILAAIAILFSKETLKRPHVERMVNN